MKIRPYRTEDFSAVTRLWDMCGISISYNDPAKDIPRMMAAPDCQLYVGEIEGQIIASIMVGLDGHRGWVYKLAVAPDHQKHGYGRRLMELAEIWLRARNIPKCHAIVRDTNLEVRGFYEALGYEVSPRSLMAKWLTDETASMESAKIDVVTTYLEMTERPTRPTIPTPRGSHALMRLDPPQLAYYRYLYNSVGEPWFWIDRRRMPDEQLMAEISAPGVEIYVLYSGGAPAGFVELDRRPMPTISVAYFGLLPEYIGRGFGRYLLNWSVDQAWTYAPARLTVDTCTLDHPRALGNYQQAGFRPYKQTHKRILDPRLEGWIPAHLEPRLPATIPNVEAT